MTKKESQSNPLLDAWMDGQEKFFKSQQEWIESTSQFSENAEKPQSVKQAEEHWESCKEQYNSWMKTTENWFPSFSNFKSSDSDITAETVKRMMDPSNFLKSGLDEINQAFYKLVDGPEFADIGTLERKFLKTSKVWAEMKKAGAEYMQITSDAWAKTFEEYTADVNKNPFSDSDTPKEILERWLTIANKNLIEIQRTDEFLKAQRDLIRAGTQYRLKQREIVEAWCESISIPSRTEVDDLHQTVYQLKKELRSLKKQVTELQSNKVSNSKTSSESLKRKLMRKV